MLRTASPDQDPAAPTLHEPASKRHVSPGVAVLLGVAGLIALYLLAPIPLSLHINHRVKGGLSSPSVRWVVALYFPVGRLTEGTPIEPLIKRYGNYLNRL